MVLLHNMCTSCVRKGTGHRFGGCSFKNVTVVGLFTSHKKIPRDLLLLAPESAQLDGWSRRSETGAVAFCFCYRGCAADSLSRCRNKTKCRCGYRCCWYTGPLDLAMIAFWQKSEIFCITCGDAFFYLGIDGFSVIVAQQQGVIRMVRGYSCFMEDEQAQSKYNAGSVTDISSAICSYQW